MPLACLVLAGELLVNTLAFFQFGFLAAIDLVNASPRTGHVPRPIARGRVELDAVSCQRTEAGASLNTDLANVLRSAANAAVPAEVAGSLVAGGL
jgi:hypothetical protein